MTKGVELIKTVSQVHYKTFFYTDISKNKYRKVSGTVRGNI